MKGGVRVQRYTLTVPDNLPDMTLDKYLAHALPLLPERARCLARRLRCLPLMKCRFRLFMRTSIC